MKTEELEIWFALSSRLIMIMRKCNIACEMQAYIYCLFEKRQNKSCESIQQNSFDGRNEFLAGFTKWSYVGHTSNTPNIVMNSEQLSIHIFYSRSFVL